MKSTDDAVLALLQSLLRICRDSIEGYATAEREMADQDLRAELERFRRQREKIAQELEGRIRDLRADPISDPTTAGAVHRRWMDLRASAAANPAEAILAEMERGEDVAVDALRHAVKRNDIDAVTRPLLQRHYEWVQAAHDRIKQLRDRAPYART